MFITKNYIKLSKYGRSEGHFGLKEENNIETKMHLTKEEVDNWGCETTTNIITSLSYINKSI